MNRHTQTKINTDVPSVTSEGSVPFCSDGSSHRSPLKPLPGYAVGVEVFPKKLFLCEIFLLYVTQNLSACTKLGSVVFEFRLSKTAFRDRHFSLFLRCGISVVLLECIMKNITKGKRTYP